MGKNNNYIDRSKIKHNNNIETMNKARGVLESYRAKLSVSLLSDIEAQYKAFVSDYDYQIKKLDNAILATRSARGHQDARKDRQADLVKHQQALRQEKQKIVEDKNQYIVEFKQAIPFFGIGPGEAHYQQPNLPREKDPIVLLADRLENFSLADDTDNRFISTLYIAYKENDNFRHGLEKAKVLHVLIKRLENNNNPEHAIDKFLEEYSRSKAKLNIHRDSQFQKILRSVFSLLSAVSPIMGLTGSSKLWQSEGKKATKKVDVILKKHKKVQDRNSPKIK